MRNREGFEGVDSGLGFGSRRQRSEADLFYADLMGRPSARPARYLDAQEDDGAAPATIDVTIRLDGLFGGDLSSTVTVKDGATVVGTGRVTAPGSELTVKVALAKKYTITVAPVAAKPDDRYRTTNHSYRPKAPYTSNAVTVKLEVNRSNRKNVDDTWRDKDIDPRKAEKVSAKPLCGRQVQINREAEAKLDAANKAFLALDATARAELTASLKIVGGHAVRTTSAGGFSNHSLGTAIDVNYNLDKKQNYFFRLSNTDEGRHDKALLAFVQEVVRTGPAFAAFDIFGGRADLLQWDAAAAFNRLFPPFLEGMVARASGTTPAATTETPAPAGANLPQPARALAVTRADVKRARDGVKDKDLARKLGLVLSEWDALSAWLYGASVSEGGKALGTQVGMIPMDRRFVELMLNAGWGWGGNWKGSKDYMHFEDAGALARLKLAPATAKEDESDEGDREVEEYDAA